MSQKKSKEYLMCAAIYYKDGKEHSSQPYNIDEGFVLCGWRHYNIIGTYSILHGAVSVRPRDQVQGFLTSTNRFLDRREALVVAKEAGQVGELISSTLTSEDLW